MIGTLKSLAMVRAPHILMQLVCLIYRANSYMCMDLDMVEYFAGKMNVARATYSNQFYVYVFFRNGKNYINICHYMLYMWP